ncbi:hypothetical protein GCM10027577_01810 [Spirosoma fluminis]
MAKENSHLHILLSPKLKQQFEAICDESEISMSNKVREMIANLVRNHNRQTGKGSKVEV